MTRVIITQAPLPALPAVRRLFADAVRVHFAYFPDDIQSRIIAEHNLPKLLLATIDRRRIILIARRHGRIVGYCLGAAPVSGPAQLFWLYVDPDQRGANIGLSLLSRMIKLLSKKGAREIAIATHDHRKYYERQGFKYRRHTVQDGVEMDILTYRVTA